MTTPIDFAELLDRLAIGQDEWISINSQVPGQQFRTTITSPEHAPAVVAELAGEANVWWGINPVAASVTGRGKVADVTRWSCLHADLDVKAGGVPSWDAARDTIDDLSDLLGTRPVAVVLTGNGLQPYWALDPEDEATDLHDEDNRAQAVACLRRWGRLVARVAHERGGAVDSVYDLPRVLRVPGTFNRKAEPKPVIGLPDDGRPVTVEELIGQLDAYAVPSYDSDTEILGGRMSEPDEWRWRRQTCPYVRTMVESWKTEEVDARHPWLLSCATRLAAAHRGGCMAQEDYEAAWEALGARMAHLCATQEPRREVEPGELREARAWAIDRVASMDYARASRELGHHGHGDEPPPAQARNSPRAEDGPADELTEEEKSLAESDDGLAIVLKERYGAVIRFCPERGRWLWWNGVIWEWQPDKGGMVRELYKRIARGLPAGDPRQIRWKQAALRAYTCTQVLQTAQTDPRLVVHQTELDNRPDEINTPLGIVILTTGELIEHDPARLHTKITKFGPDSEHTSILWDDYMRQTFAGDEDMIAFMARLVGVSATGYAEPHILPFCSGTGGNGKGVFVETIMAVLADYASAAPPNFLMSGPARHLTEMADLQGRRMVVASEVNEDDKFDEAKMKRLTGGDKIKANFMRQDMFAFDPTHHLWLVGNHRPKIASATTNDSVWRRVKEIKFVNEVPEEDRIDGLKERLVNECGPAIMAWIVRGAADYFGRGTPQKRGDLAIPEAVQEATSDYRTEMDTVSQFLDERCHIGGGTQVTCPKPVIFSAYEQFCKDAGEAPASHKAFTKALQKRGLVDSRNRHQRFWYGVTILNSEDDEQNWPVQERFT